jgi:hypothetical protein
MVGEKCEADRRSGMGDRAVEVDVTMSQILICVTIEQETHIAFRPGTVNNTMIVEGSMSPTVTEFRGDEHKAFFHPVVEKREITIKDSITMTLARTMTGEHEVIYHRGIEDGEPTLDKSTSETLTSVITKGGIQVRFHHSIGDSRVVIR